MSLTIYIGILAISIPSFIRVVSRSNPTLSEYFDRERRRVGKQIIEICGLIRKGDSSWWGNLLVEMLKISWKKLCRDLFQLAGMIVIITAGIGLVFVHILGFSELDSFTLTISGFGFLIYIILLVRICLVK
jgi:hypothetical protein